MKFYAIEVAAAAIFIELSDAATFNGRGPHASNPIDSEVNDDRSCVLFNLLVQDQLLAAEELCYCTDTWEVDCVYGTLCGDNGLCADSANYSISAGTESTNVNYCIEFVEDSGYEYGCTNMEFNFDETLASCETTYGGKDCVCEVCDDLRSLNIDCSMHDPGATTNGCQSLTDDWSPTVPTFEFPKGDENDDHRDSDPTKGGDRSCTLFDLLVQDQLLAAEELCYCADTWEVDCVYGKICGDNGLCADSANYSISAGTESTNVNYCIEFVEDSGYENGCTNMEFNFDETLASCETTYGGKDCVCEVCDDLRSLNIDCSMHDPGATLNGCQSLTEDWTPTVPTFEFPKGGAKDNHHGSDPTKGGDRSCTLFDLLVQDQLLAAEELCYCADTWEVDCVYGEICGDNGLCADSTNFHIAAFNGFVNVNYCIEFVEDSGYENGCTNMEFNFDETLASCKTTYGGKDCVCEVCDDLRSLSIDCSMHDPGATTNGCQPLTDDWSPSLPAFDFPKVSKNEDRNSGGGSSKNENRNSAGIVVSVVFLALFVCVWLVPKKLTQGQKALVIDGEKKLDDILEGNAKVDKNKASELCDSITLGSSTADDESSAAL